MTQYSLPQQVSGHLALQEFYMIRLKKHHPALQVERKDT